MHWLLLLGAHAHHHHVEPDPGVLGAPQEDTVGLLVYCQPDSEVASLGGQVHVLNVGQLHLQASGFYIAGNIGEKLTFHNRDGLCWDMLDLS